MPFLTVLYFASGWQEGTLNLNLIWCATEIRFISVDICILLMINDWGNGEVDTLYPTNVVRM